MAENTESTDNPKSAPPWIGIMQTVVTVLLAIVTAVNTVLIVPLVQHPLDFSDRIAKQSEALSGQDGRTAALALVSLMPLASDKEDKQILLYMAGLRARDPEMQSVLVALAKAPGYSDLVSNTVREMAVNGLWSQTVTEAPSPASLVPSPTPKSSTTPKGSPTPVSSPTTRPSPMPSPSATTSNSELSDLAGDQTNEQLPAATTAVLQTFALESGCVYLGESDEHATAFSKASIVEQATLPQAGDIVTTATSVNLRQRWNRHSQITGILPAGSKLKIVNSIDLQGPQGRTYHWAQVSVIG